MDERVLHRQSYVHGWADEMAGKGFLDNPYPQDSNDARIWVDGYVASMIARRSDSAKGDPK